MPRAKLLIALSVVFLLGALTPYLASTAEDKPRELPTLKAAYLDMGRLFNECTTYKNAIARMKEQTVELEESFKAGNAEMKEIAEALKKLQVGSDEFKKKTSELGKMELDLKFRQATVRQEFEAKITTVQYTLFERIEKICHRVCEQYDVGLLLRHSTTPINPKDSSQVLRAINSTIVYADPQLDLTSKILAELEQMPAIEVPEVTK